MPGQAAIAFSICKFTTRGPLACPPFNSICARVLARASETSRSWTLPGRRGEGRRFVFAGFHQKAPISIHNRCIAEFLRLRAIESRQSPDPRGATLKDDEVCLGVPRNIPRICLKSAGQNDPRSPYCPKESARRDCLFSCPQTKPSS